jgi:hypothetical protein
MTRDERDRLLRQRRSALDRHEACMEQANRTWGDELDGWLEQAKGHREEARAAEAAYFEALPAVAMACCPYDGRPLLRSFDPFDFDGPWWSPDATPREPPPCPHFCCVTGAVALGGQPARVPEGSVYLGGDVPFVIPRLLAFEEMTAVIGQLEMENGCRAYPIAYFAARRPPPEKLAANWARPIFAYTTQMGLHLWRVDDEVWDRDLLPWIVRDKVRWCALESGNSQLDDGPPEQCPFLELPGTGRPTVLQSQGADRPALIELTRPG